MGLGIHSHRWPVHAVCGLRRPLQIGSRAGKPLLLPVPHAVMAGSRGDSGKRTPDRGAVSARPEAGAAWQGGGAQRQEQVSGRRRAALMWGLWAAGRGNLRKRPLGGWNQSWGWAPLC